jgi:thioredoxin reductase (NADPH)
MAFDPLYLTYAAPLLGIWGYWSWRAHRRSQHARAVLEDNRRAGLDQPASLHPVIDPALCLGCAACAHACPEKKIIGIIDGKAALIEPTMCVGHGACRDACPTDAITLVFGTETRGIDIPLVSPDFESSVSGIFIAGELGGMGLIKNAIEQGRQAIDAVARRCAMERGDAGVLDVVVVGCGPAGIAASLGAMEHKLSFVTLDQNSLGGTVAHFPRGKLVMTAPATLPLVGKVEFGEISKEKLLAFWTDVMERTGLSPNFGERVTAVEKSGEHFVVATSAGTYRTKTVLLAIGRRGTPRTLDVPGEDLEKVVYRMIDPAQYAGQHVLVVGGGDSALEAAAEIADQPGSTVTLSYRGAAFSRARAKNRDRISGAIDSGRVRILLGSVVQEIERDRVHLVQESQTLVLSNDAVIICAGGILPTQFLHGMGIEVETKFGVA